MIDVKGRVNSLGLESFWIEICLLTTAERGKFVKQCQGSGSRAKVLAAVPSISQPRRVYCEHGNEDRLESGGEAVVNKDLSTEFWKSVFWNRNFGLYVDTV